MGWLDGDVDIGDYDWGQSDGAQSVLDNYSGGYETPDVSWGYGGTADWTPTYTNYGVDNGNSVGYGPLESGGGGYSGGSSGGGGATGYSLPGGSVMSQGAPSAPGATAYAQPSGGSGITQAAGAAMKSGESKSLVDKALGFLKDKEGDYDPTKILKLVTTAGALYQSKKNQENAPGAQSSAQLQAQLGAQASRTWTPQQQVWANNFLQTPINANRKTVQAGANGIKSIIPSRGYASGGGIGAVGDTRYGNVPQRLPDAPRESNIWDQFRRRNEEQAGLRAPVEILQEGNTPRVSSEMYSTGEILKAILQLMSPKRDEGEGMAKGGSVSSAAQKEQEQALSGVVPLANLIAELQAAQHLRANIAQAGGNGGGTIGFMDGGGVVQEGPLSHGNFGLIQGEGDGQSDSVPIDAAPGKYIFDAESVSMLGNGSNEAGAQVLDQWRQSLREQKRGAPLDEIAPEAEHPDAYLPGAQ